MHSDAPGQKLLPLDEPGSLVVLSRHAEARCLERGISMRLLVEAVLYGEVVANQGKREVYQRNRLCVVLEGAFVVTAFRMTTISPKRRTRAKTTRRTRLRHRLAREFGRGAV